MVKVRVRWWLYVSEDRLESEMWAITKGWAEGKVQVRLVPNTSDDPCNITPDLYYVEPFDACNCPQIIRYEDRLLGWAVVPLESTESNDRAANV